MEGTATWDNEIMMALVSLTEQAYGMQILLEWELSVEKGFRT